MSGCQISGCDARARHEAIGGDGRLLLVCDDCADGLCSFGWFVAYGTPA